MLHFDDLRVVQFCSKGYGVLQITLHYRKVDPTLTIGSYNQVASLLAFHIGGELSSNLFDGN